MSDRTQTKDLTQLFETNPESTPELAPPLPPADLPSVETPSVEAPPVEAPSVETPEVAPIGVPEIEAAYPFHLYIEGKLRPQDRTALVDWLKVHQIDIRESELEPQLAAGRILLPRISEFVGISIVQLLRTAPVNMRLEPAPTEHSDIDWKQSELAQAADFGIGSDSSPMATIPVLHGPPPPGLEQAEVIGTVQQVGLIDVATGQHDADSLQKTIDRLTHSLAQKAMLKHATHVVRLDIQIEAHGPPALHRQTYRVHVQGVAIRLLNN